jgi:hypothetical protein
MYQSFWHSQMLLMLSYVWWLTFISKEQQGAKHMPASVVHTPHEEKLWERAKNAVERSKLKKHTKFNDQDWGLVMHIFQGMKKKEAKSELVAELGKLGIPVVGEFVKRSSIKAALAAVDAKGVARKSARKDPL